MELKIEAYFDKRTKHYYRYRFNDGVGTFGLLYVSRKRGGVIPEKVTLLVRSRKEKEENEEEGNDILKDLLGDE